MTDSMKVAIGETERRRAKQMAFNEANGITPRGVVKRIKDIIDGVYNADDVKAELTAAAERARYEDMSESRWPRRSSGWRSRCSTTPRTWSSKRRPRCAISSRSCGRRCSGPEPKAIISCRRPRKRSIGDHPEPRRIAGIL
jgi:hypothetical protein